MMRESMALCVCGINIKYRNPMGITSTGFAIFYNNLALISKIAV